MTNSRPKPVVLIVLDGYGYREDVADNAIAAARTPTYSGQAEWQVQPSTMRARTETPVTVAAAIAPSLKP